MIARPGSRREVAAWLLGVAVAVGVAALMARSAGSRPVLAAVDNGPVDAPQAVMCDAAPASTPPADHALMQADDQAGERLEHVVPKRDDAGDPEPAVTPCTDHGAGEAAVSGQSLRHEPASPRASSPSVSDGRAPPPLVA